MPIAYLPCVKALIQTLCSSPCCAPRMSDSIGDTWSAKSTQVCRRPLNQKGLVVQRHHLPKGWNLGKRTQQDIPQKHLHVFESGRLRERSSSKNTYIVFVGFELSASLEHKPCHLHMLTLFDKNDKVSSQRMSRSIWEQNQKENAKIASHTGEREWLQRSGTRCNQKHSGQNKTCRICLDEGRRKGKTHSTSTVWHHITFAAP